MNDPATAPTPSPEDIRRALLVLSESMNAILDAVDGYRAQMTERGYSPTVAEAAALDFHSHLLASVFKGVPGK